TTHGIPKHKELLSQGSLSSKHLCPTTGPLKECGCEEDEGEVRDEGRSLKDFKVIDILGKGGFGSVYLVSRRDNEKDDAESSKEEHFYALKVIDKNKIKGNSKDIQHALTEMDIMTDLEHPYIVKIFDIFESSRRICYLMEFLQGGELYTWLDRRDVFEEPVARYYLGQIFLALIYLHEEGILYRDLKPENIMLDVSGNIKLVDFGLSQNHMNRKRTKTMCGTACYMPPEVIRREWYSFAADWWSFGILAYDMMVGAPPFMCDSSEDTRESILNDKISFPFKPTLSRCARILIKSLLTKDPKRRPSGWGVAKFSFFDPIDFKDLLLQECSPPPLLPKVSSPQDMTHFPAEGRSEGKICTSEFDSFPEKVSDSLCIPSES
ncbi:Ribosomal protein S6 kinase beta-2, partial [Caligus rogercresseyi]